MNELTPEESKERLYFWGVIFNIIVNFEPLNEHE
jgi:hypothetical protein